MGTIYNCDASELVEKASEELKKNEAIKPTVWAIIVKTGMHKERPPSKNDWWYIRSASVLRKIYRYGPIGVSKLRTKYGGKKNRGVKPEHFYKGSGNIIRKILQQLETAGFVKKEEKDVHKGRVITAEGKKFLNGIASQISKIPAQKEPKKETKQEVKPKSAAKTKDIEKKEKTDKKDIKITKKIEPQKENKK